jgi:hypothetical protein
MTALYSRADLIVRLKNRLGRPSADLAFTRTTTDDVFDACLTEAQDTIKKKLAMHVPDSVWPDPTLLTSADGGYTYGFGTDTDGAAIFAHGHFRVYESKADMPDYPLLEGIDYAVDRTVIRMIPYDRQRTFSAGPYALFASPGNVIDATHEPVVPTVARLALLSEAEVNCWRSLGMDAQGAEATAERDWNDCLTVIKTQSMFKTGTPERALSRFAAAARRRFR